MSWSVDYLIGSVSTLHISRWHKCIIYIFWQAKLSYFTENLLKPSLHSIKLDKKAQFFMYSFIFWVKDLRVSLKYAGIIRFVEVMAQTGWWSLSIEYRTSVMSSEWRICSDVTLTLTGCWQGSHEQPWEQIIDAKKLMGGSDEWKFHIPKNLRKTLCWRLDHILKSMAYSHIAVMIRRTGVSNAEMNKAIWIL